MNRLLVTVAATLSFANSAHAIQILDARLDANGENILATVRHGGGGPGYHRYRLDLQGCAESMPVQCRAKLIHETNDFAEALITRKITLNLAENGIEGDYYSNGSLTILGESRSQATVTLPDFSGEVPTPVGRGVSCTTHTGSRLVIDSRARRVSLATRDGETAHYEITREEFRSLESMPPVAQTTYHLDDGRAVVTSFRGESRQGTGNFIRLDGSYSPDFSCSR